MARATAACKSVASMLSTAAGPLIVRAAVKEREKRRPLRKPARKPLCLGEQRKFMGM